MCKSVVRVVNNWIVSICCFIIHGLKHYKRCSVNIIQITAAICIGQNIFLLVRSAIIFKSRTKYIFSGSTSVFSFRANNWAKLLTISLF